MTQLRTLVTPSGVYVCPYFRGVASKKIGDVRKTSFADMWHGEQRQKIIENLNPSRDCKMPCIRHESNLILEDMIAGEIFEIIDDFDLFIQYMEFSKKMKKKDMIAAWVINWLKARNLNSKLNIRSEDNFYKCGYIDSFGIIELITEIEDYFSICFEDSDFHMDGFLTISGMAEIIYNKKGTE
eukprot:TRINITY_DN2142_c0_g1_i3.p2 TRINITY_DN2142_c0_g1~~TRINITY_DN2142_c0_g1_i3.p2  ORF type:complete len:183 (-),score=23.24 TRINITY_DN2142_c0_g1_i3:422-970(-)